MDNKSTINLLHVLVVAPLLIYVGYIGKKCDDMLFNILLVTGVVSFLYHLSSYLTRPTSLEVIQYTPEGFEDLLNEEIPPEGSDELTTMVLNPDEIEELTQEETSGEVEGFSW